MFVNVRRSHIGLIRDEDIIIGNFVFEWATETDWNGAVERRGCLLYTSPSPRDEESSRMPSSA